VAPPPAGAPELADRAACPLCGGPPVAVVAVEQWEGVAIRVVRCGRCGGGFSTPVPTLAYRRATYRRWSAEDPRATRQAHFGIHQQPRNAALYRRALRVLAGAGARGRLLDVGCAGGMALLFAQDFEAVQDGSGWRRRFEAEGLAVTDEEWSQTSAVTGCPVHRAEDLPGLPDGRFAAVTAFNTLEHVHEPLPLLGELRRVLAPEGALYVVVPNNAFLFLRLRAGIGRVPGLEPFEHLNHFTPRSLTELLRRAGFGRVRLLDDAPGGTQGFFHRLGARDVAKWGVFACVGALTGKRAYWYPQILALARP